MITRDKFKKEWISRTGDILRLNLNKGSSYVQLIAGRQRIFLYQATPTKQVSESGGLKFARDYMRKH